MKFCLIILVVTLLYPEKQSVSSLPRMRNLFTNVSFITDSSLINIKSTFSDTQINLTTVMYRNFDNLFGDFHLDVRMLNNPSPEYERFLDKSIDFCVAMLNPLSEPLFTMIFNQMKAGKFNKIFTECPVKVVGYHFVFNDFLYCTNTLTNI